MTLNREQPAERDSRTITLGGDEIAVRELLAGEVRTCAKLAGKDGDEYEALLIHKSTSAPIEDCRSFLLYASLEEYSLLMTTIAEVSKLTEGAQKSS